MQQTIDSHDRNWAMAAHLTAFAGIFSGLFVIPFGNVLGPLVVLLAERKKSAFVTQHAKASLNFQITLSIAYVVLFVIVVATSTSAARPLNGSVSRIYDTTFLVAACAVVLGFFVWLLFIILGTVAANQGRPYTYPFAIRFLR